MGHHCCSKQKVKKGLWSPEEDEKLIKHITAHGHSSWSSVPKLAGLQRCGKSCRLRWINYLRPDVKRGSFSAQEERIIIDVHRILGNKWAQIAKYMPGRTDNEVKNFWNSSIKKKLIAQGFDPATHNLLISNSIDQTHNNTDRIISQSPFMSFDYPTNYNSPCFFSILNQIFMTTPALEKPKSILCNTANFARSTKVATPSPSLDITTTDHHHHHHHHHHHNLLPAISTSSPSNQSGFQTAWSTGGGFPLVGDYDHHNNSPNREKMNQCQGMDFEKADGCSLLGGLPDESLDFDIDFVELLN